MIFTHSEAKPIGVRLTRLASVALLMIFGFCGQRGAWAQTIVYTYSSVGSGSLGGITFNDEPFTITATADTNSIFTFSPGLLRVPDETASVFVTGLGSATFVSTLNFANHGIAVGISDGSNADDILDIRSSALASYNLSTAIGPVSGTSAINNGTNFMTSEGDFVLTSRVNCDFPGHA